MRNCDMFKTYDDATHAYGASLSKDKIQMAEWLYKEYDCRDFSKEEFEYVMSKDNFTRDGIQFPQLYNVKDAFEKQRGREAFILDNLVNGALKEFGVMIPKRYIVEVFGTGPFAGSLMNDISHMFKKFNICNAMWCDGWFKDFEELEDISKWDMDGIRKFVNDAMMEDRLEKERKAKKALNKKVN